MLGLLKFLWLIITVVVLYNIWSEKATEITVKLMWTLVILFLPVLGPILWLWIGRRQSVKS